MWVVQEVALAKVAWAQRGMMLFGKDSLFWMAYTIGRHRDLGSFALEMGRKDDYTGSAASLIALCYWGYKLHGRFALCVWLTNCVTMDASNPWDHFFALAGLSFGIHPTFIDYNETLRETLIEAGVFALLTNPNYEYASASIDLLTWNENTQSYRLGVPSWVPDITTKWLGGRMSMVCAYSTKALSKRRYAPEPEIRGIVVSETPKVVDSLVYDTPVGLVSLVCLNIPLSSWILNVL